MFNRNNSAYGRGITSNLVTEQERQRFNYGGRVGAFNGISIGSGRGANQNYDRLMGPKPWEVGPDDQLLDYWEIYGDPEERQNIKKKIAQDKAKKELREQGKRDFTKAREVMTDIPYYAKGIAPIEKADDPGATQVDLESDVLYTPQEQAEKKSQMAFALAERLIGGSRDKWGSTAQMKNIAGGIGDIRKIADPSERREMLAKYKAWGKAQSERDVTSREHQYKMESDPEWRFKKARDAGSTEQDALNRAYNAKITIVSEARDKKKGKDKIAANPSKYKGRIIFDEDEQVYRISDGMKWTEITVDQIKESTS